MRTRGIADAGALPGLRFDPACWYRPDAEASRQIWPALIAAITDESGTVTGIHRTWLSRDGGAKAPVDTPRPRWAVFSVTASASVWPMMRSPSAKGSKPSILALRMALPALPMIAALSPNHLAALSYSPDLCHFVSPATTTRLAVRVVRRLTDRATPAGIAAHVLSPAANDFDTDLARLGSPRCGPG